MVVGLCHTIGLQERASEELHVFFLNTKSRRVGTSAWNSSAIPTCRDNASLVHPREVYKGALLANANAIMVVHNHPSGNPEPSRADKEVTTKLIQAGNIFDVDSVSAAFPNEKNIWISKVYSLFFAIFGNFSEHFSRIRKVQKREILRNWRSFGMSLSEYKV